MGVLFSCNSSKKINTTNINDKNLKITENKINIIYLEDIELHFDLLNFILNHYLNTDSKNNKKNFNLCWGKTIQEAYNFIRDDNKYDLIFIDRKLSNNENGDDFVDRIVREKLIPINKIIFLSELTIDNKCQKYIDKGAFYIKKPIDVNRLIETMKNIFD